MSHAAPSFFASDPRTSAMHSVLSSGPLASALDAKSPRNSGVDLDVFSNLTETKPGTIPLLVRLPDGEQSQLDVPLNSTVDQVSAMLRDPANPDDLRLSFGNMDLPPDASLLDTNIVEAYEHAGSLLHLIGSAGGDPDAKAAALDSACAVVESISNGVKDMEALCAAALDPALAPHPPNSPRTAGIVAEGAAQAARETPKELDGSEFKMLNSMLSRPDNNSVDAPQQKATTPAELALGLSRRLPHIFPPEAAAAAFGYGEEQIQPENHAPQQEEQPSLGRRASLVIQPSISAIREAREARRKQKQLSAPADEEKRAREQAANAVTIGNSTNGMPLPPDLPGRGGNADMPQHMSSAPPPGRGGGGTGAVLMAADAKSTWLEDVMKTWEVGVVRQSGVLEKTKDGQELNEYLDGLEEEAQRDLETAKIEAEGKEDESEDSDEEYEGNTRRGSGRMEDVEIKENGTGGLSRSTATAVPRGRAAGPQMTHLMSSASTGLHHRPSTPSSDSSHPTMPFNSGQTSSSGADSTRAPSLSSYCSQPMDASSKPTEIGTASTKPPVVRQATKIAPALNIAIAPMGVPVNGMFPSQILPGGVGAPGIAWPPRPARPIPKKRGRKRKNPELTEEERALVRKEQNRESAKLSRVRRKVIAAEYEGRLNDLLGENSMLRKQVEGLNNRLVYLQSLLTVSVRQEDKKNP